MSISTLIQAQVCFCSVFFTITSIISELQTATPKKNSLIDPLERKFMPFSKSQLPHIRTQSNILFFGIPLLELTITLSLLHWFTYQSIFLEHLSLQNYCHYLIHGQSSLLFVLVINMKDVHIVLSSFSIACDPITKWI